MCICMCICTYTHTHTNIRTFTYFSISYTSPNKSGKNNSIETQQNGRDKHVLFVPVSKQFPKIRIFTRQAAELANKRILVSIDSWDETSKFPTGFCLSLFWNASVAQNAHLMLCAKRRVCGWWCDVMCICII